MRRIPTRGVAARRQQTARAPVMISLKVVRCRSGVIMNKLFVGGVAIAALIAGRAIAADMPAPAPVVVDSWTGFYVGASLGGRFTDSNWMTTCLSVGAPGGIGCPVNLIAQNGPRLPLSNPSAFASATLRPSVYVGYNWQIGTWVVGAEADAGWGKARNDMKGIPGAGEPGIGGEPGSRYRSGQHHLGCESARPRRLPDRHQRPALRDRWRVLDPHGDERLLRQSPQSGRLVRGARRAGIEPQHRKHRIEHPHRLDRGGRGRGHAVVELAHANRISLRQLRHLRLHLVPRLRGLRRRLRHHRRGGDASHPYGARRVRVQVRRAVACAVAPGFRPVLRPAERVVGATAPLYTSLTKRLTGLSMKVVEIVPRARTRLYGMLVAKEAAIRQGGRGTYVRVGRKRKDAARWKHRNYQGSVDLKRGESEVVTAQVRAANPEDERKLLSSFLGFVDRHSGDQVATITIHYR